MKPNLKIKQDDLLTLFAHTRFAYGNITFANWCKECKNGYIIYFNNKELFNRKEYTYSQWVNEQIISLT